MRHLNEVAVLIVCIVGSILLRAQAQTTAPQGKIRVACIGASITFGAGINDREKDCYPAQMQNLLGAGYEVRNYGVSGRTMLKRGDFPYWNERAYQEAMAFNPDIVVIDLGGNDSKPQNWKFKDDFAADAKAMIASFRTLPAKPRVLLCLPMPAFKVMWGINDEVITKEQIPILQQVASETAAEVIDLHTPFLNKQAWFADSIHPNAEGAGLMAKIIGGVIAPKAAAPDFGPNVLVFDPSMPNIQELIDAVFKRQERSQFGSERYAYLFKPGKYNLDVQVGFYMQVVGLGQSPDDVAITGAVRSKATWMRGNATCNFWRTVENLSVTPTQDGNVNVWAVSQGVALRRAHIKGDMNLWDNGWCSGGFMADCRIDGRVNSGSQQQWFSRNAQWGSWVGGSWNMVFVGAVNPPEGSWPARPYTVIDRTPVIREKPYLFIDNTGRYFVMVPSLQSDGAKGITWSGGSTPGTRLPIDQFYLARADKDNAASINIALSQGKNLLLTPGIYHLESSIRVSRPGTVVLGIGYPTLVPDKGTPAMEIADVDGVKVGGILFDAAATNSPTLLQVGEPGSSASHAADPVFLYDIYCRVGGAGAGTADCMVTIHSNNVVGDNFWLWRADHGQGVGWTVKKNANGLIVNGNDVTLYGLFVDHCQEYQTIWNGNGGRVNFYQSEMPYDPPSAEAWRHGAVTGYASYKVTDKVTTHEAWGLGVYCVFYRAPVVAENAIESPTGPGIKMHHMVTIRLGGGRTGSGINHVINGQGNSVTTTMKSIVD
jgi:lysophospholipase L1-like esterase